MKKYAVHGVVEVEVVKEVLANSEEEAYEKAYDELSCLTEYCGNGGYDKLIGVEEPGESVFTRSNDIEYNDIEVLEDNPDYMECPDCHEELEEQLDDFGNRTGWFCPECTNWFDDDGEIIYPDDEEEE